MKKFIMKGAEMLLATCLVSGMMASCSDDDKNYDDVQPPVVVLKEATLGGMVTTISGTPIEGATVTATLNGQAATATTDATGTYLFDKLTSAGSYTLKATAAGKLEATGTVEVVAGKTVLWSVQLANEGKEVAVSQSQETTVEVVTEAPQVAGAEAQVTVANVIPAAAVDDAEATILFTPVYSDEQAKQTRAQSKGDELLAGMSVSCSNPNAKLNSPVSMTFRLDETTSAAVKGEKLVNGSWQEIDATVSGGDVTLQADEFTSYRLSLEVTISTSQGTEPVTFGQSEFDNLYGKSDLSVGSVSYSYKQGAELGVSGSQLAGYLSAMLGRQLGISTVTTVTGTYDINVTLPVGTAMTLTGTQIVESMTISSHGVSVNGKSYGAVSLSANTYNRQHTGGGSGTI